MDAKRFVAEYERQTRYLAKLIIPGVGAIMFNEERTEKMVEAARRMK